MAKGKYINKRKGAERPKLKLYSPEEVAPQKSTVLLYGLPASGKSTFASTYPGPYYVVPSMAANEIRAIYDMGFKDNVVVFSTMEDLLDQVQALVTAIQAGELPDCHTVIFDNLTAAQMVVEESLLKMAGKERMEHNEWSAFTAIWKRLVNVLHDLPINVIWVAHSKIKDVAPQGSATPAIEESFSLMGGARNFVPGQADLMLYAESRSMGKNNNNEFRIWLKFTGLYPARVRGNLQKVKKLPPYIGGLNKEGQLIDPHYDQLASLFGWSSQAEVEGVEEQPKETDDE